MKLGIGMWRGLQSEAGQLCMVDIDPTKMSFVWKLSNDPAEDFLAVNDQGPPQCPNSENRSGGANTEIDQKIIWHSKDFLPMEPKYAVVHVVNHNFNSESCKAVPSLSCIHLHQPWIASTTTEKPDSGM